MNALILALMLMQLPSAGGSRCHAMTCDGQVIAIPCAKRSAKSRAGTITLRNRRTPKTVTLPKADNTSVLWHGTSGKFGGMAQIPAGGGSGIVYYEPESRACTVPALLAALEEADREFVVDPNARAKPDDPRDQVPKSWDDDVIRGPAPFYPTHKDNRTPAQMLRDEADAEAKELERKSAAAKRIREVLAACKNSVANGAAKK